MTADLGFDQPCTSCPSTTADLPGENGRRKGPPNAEHSAVIAALKGVIYDGFRAALAGAGPGDKAGILVDEQFGAAILRDASRVTRRPCAVEKSGQDEFDFEYGDDFACPHRGVRPDLRQGPGALQPRGGRRPERPPDARLKRLSDYLRGSGRLFMFELLMPPVPEQLARVGGDKKAYDVELRPGLMVAVHPRLPGGRGRARRLEDRGTRSAQGLRAAWSRRPGKAGGTGWAASSSAGARTASQGAASG